MSPEMQVRGSKAAPTNNIYTAVIALTLIVVLAAAIFVAYKCHAQYGKIFFDIF